MPPEIPLATYRLQLTKDFGFDHAAAIVPYLKALGISHVYASPFLKARAGSQHGYDIVDHRALNPELGGDEGFARLSQALADADLGLILDFVPNHMGVGRADNPWWLDVLEWGPKSPYARAFDIDWETLPYKATGGVLLPILGQTYGDALEAGEIKLDFDPGEGNFSAWYFEHRLPIRPNRYGDILRTVVAAAGASNDAVGRRLLDIASLYPDPHAPTREQAATLKRALAELGGGADIIGRGLVAYRPAPANPDPMLVLHRLLERQHYRLAHWRVAVSEINYRRFFDVNDLAGLRVEDMWTFTAVHHVVIRLIAEGRLHGLRLDHIDGLQNPVQYADRLRRLIRRARGGQPRPFYTLVEKILGEGEAMPRLPGIAGTTGYEWLNVISRLLTAPDGIPKLRDAATELTGNSAPLERIVEQSKRRVLDTILASEFTVLARLLKRIASGHWRTRDFTLDRLRLALRAFVLHFPVYRTYVTSERASATDRATIATAIAAARAQWFGPDASIFDFLQEALTLDLVASGRKGYSQARVRRFALKVQQFTGPLMAKSLEDTAFYRYFPVLALNEVGGDPSLPALAVADFHRQMEQRAKHAPYGLTATATHDTKRGEDTRARLLALSEFADEWAAEAKHWASLNEKFASKTGSRRAPSRAHEYLLYQTLVGSWPTGGATADYVARIEAYATKAAREGKLDTSWMHPDEAYEDALIGFIRHVLDPQQAPEFLERIAGLAQRVALVGAMNSLSQLALKATMPGVPDFYQGTEFWDLSLVDPDNRRAVDYAARRTALNTIDTPPDWVALTEQWADGRLKLALTRALLGLRQSVPRLFTHGRYRSLPVTGPHADHVVAFERSVGRESVVVIVGRGFAAASDAGRRWSIGRDWNATVELPGGPIMQSVLPHARDELRGPIPISELLADIPVALLRVIPAPFAGGRALAKPRAERTMAS